MKMFSKKVLMKSLYSGCLYSFFFHFTFKSLFNLSYIIDVTKERNHKKSIEKVLETVLVIPLFALCLRGEEEKEAYEITKGFHLIFMSCYLWYAAVTTVNLCPSNQHSCPWKEIFVLCIERNVKWDLNGYGRLVFPL